MEKGKECGMGGGGLIFFSLDEILKIALCEKRGVLGCFSLHEQEKLALTYVRVI